MAEVEGEAKLGVERPEQEREHPLVALVDQLHANRAEPISEQAHAIRELGHHPGAVSRQLRRELESVRSLPGPASKLLLRRQSVAGRVQLDGAEALRIEAEKLARVGAGRIEARLPRRVRPARSADVEIRQGRRASRADAR